MGRIIAPKKDLQFREDAGWKCLHRFRPLDLDFAVVGQTVAQVQVDEALVGDACFFGHAFEIRHDIFGQAHGDGFFEFGSVWVFAGSQFGKVVFGFHISHLGKKRFRAWLLCERK
jgi:hypothetical protein